MGAGSPTYLAGECMSNIENNSVVSFNYVLTNTAGEVIDQSQDGQPLVYLHGAGNIIPGLEKSLLGKTAGDKLNVAVTAEDAYGPYDPEMIQEVPREMFQGVDAIEVGMQFHADTHDGAMQIVTVKGVTDTMVTIDANHPMAGQDLAFAVEIVEVRAASEEEIAHGHVHGAGGHQH